jgi:hypothetical protein
MVDSSSNVMRGQRLRTVREALGQTQTQFAELLTRTAAQLGIDARYVVGDVSARETGRKALDVEDYAIVSALDPQRWSWEWLAFGRKLTKGTKVGGRVAKTGTD